MCTFVVHVMEVSVWWEHGCVEMFQVWLALDGFAWLSLDGFAQLRW